jgi:hypothetical protein
VAALLGTIVPVRAIATSPRHCCSRRAFLIAITVGNFSEALSGRFSVVLLMDAATQ